jgi:hypothetical protein
MAGMRTVMLAGVGMLATPVVDGMAIHRMIIRVALPEPGAFTLEIENPAATPISSTETTELALEPEPRLQTLDPYAPAISYRAAVDLSGDAAVRAGAATLLEVPAASKRRWRGTLADLGWHRKEGVARLGAHQLAQVVPAGRYKLSFWVGGWRSNEVAVVVLSGGRVSGVDGSRE